MKLMYWTEGFWPSIGGVEVRSLMLLRALLRRGYRVCVVTARGGPDLPEAEVFQGIEIHRFPFEVLHAHPSPSDLLRIGRSIGQLWSTFQPDVVDIQFSGPSVFFYLRTRGIHPTPLLLTVSVAPSAAVAGGDTLLGQVIRAASWITAPAEAPLREVHALVPESIARSSVILNALEDPPMPPTPLPFDAPRILCLGRLVENKGFDRWLLRRGRRSRRGSPALAWLSPGMALSGPIWSGRRETWGSPRASTSWGGSPRRGFPR